jgi:cytoskeleton protein RodZ
MSSERAEQPAAPNNHHGIPGKTLAAQREAMGWSVEQVADQLKMAVRQVVALEAGDYTALPGPAVTRGFVRAYAKLMKLDPVPLVAQIEMDTPPAADLTANAAAMRRPSPASFSESKFPARGKRSVLPLAWILSAVAVIAAGAAAWHFGLVSSLRGEQPAAVTGTGVQAPTGAAPETANGSSVETLQNPAVPLISVPGASSSASAPAAAPAAGPVVTVPATTATGAPPTTAPAAPATPATAQGGQPVATQAPAAAGAGALVISVRQDAWIEVRPAKGGNPLIKRLVKAGSTETVTVDQPMRVIVGNPGAVSASLRGTPVALPLVPGKTYALVNVQ